MKAKNRRLHKAKAAKNDEFYTQLSDIEKEMVHYKDHFRDKIVMCNCDDPYVSNFFKYFSLNFEALGLKKLVTTCYKNQDATLFSKGDVESAVYLEYNGDRNGNRTPDAHEIGTRQLAGDGDFRSPECIALMQQADIIVTNPPFSLFREYIAQLIEYDKKFIVLGSMNAITYKEIFPLLKDNKMWLGHTSPTSFTQPNEDKPKKMAGLTMWFSNLETTKQNEKMILFKKYTPEEYPKYDNYDAINVNRLVDIPVDYDGIMGVPITFMDKYNPKQFEILGIDRYIIDNPVPGKRFTILDKEIYARILIKRKERSE